MVHRIVERGGGDRAEGVGDRQAEGRLNARERISLASLILAAAALLASVLLISAPESAGYSGAIPWSAGSWLKPLTDVLSLGGLVHTARGTEIKDYAFHLAAGIALLVLAARALVSGLVPPARPTNKGVWFASQGFFLGWVVFSFASCAWTDDPAAAFGQSSLYLMGVAWALTVGWTLESRHVRAVLAILCIAAVAAAGLCLWYHTERNPEHRPGFPIGNPATLAALLLAGLMISGAWLAQGRVGVLPDKQRRWLLLSPLALAAVMMIVVGFRLADSRGAYLGLVAGVLAVVLVRVRPWIRWSVLVGLLLLVVAGVWYAASAPLDLAMARGETIRFRLYAWKYAAVLWSYRMISGFGAGAYPRIAGSLAVEDRALDPAAFMAELIEHAHNEFFEVFAEIGLLGGLLLVAGYVATFVAGGACLHEQAGRDRCWIRTALLASLAGLLTDGLLGPGLRLSVVPLVHYTILGLIWAECREATRRPETDRAARTAAWMQGLLRRRYVVAAAATVGAIVLLVLAQRNWLGVLGEYDAQRALDGGSPSAARQLAAPAAAQLLDPVRQLACAEIGVLGALGAAREEMARLVAATSSARSSGSARSDDGALESQRRAGLRVAEHTFTDAWALARRAPAFARVEGHRARAAELVAQLHSLGRPPEDRAAVEEWSGRAFQAWVALRGARPYDREALLAISNYLFPRDDASLLGDYIGLLRDALRSGAIDDLWSRALARAAEAASFESVLYGMVAAAAPYGPQSEANSLMISGAPEIHRVRARWRAAHGEFLDAADDARQAAAMYDALRRRLPGMRSIALSEQAEYQFAADPSAPEESITLMKTALDALPAISKQKRDDLARPLRLSLASYFAAAGREPEALDVLRAAEPWVDPEGSIAERYLDVVRRVLRRPAAVATRIDPQIVKRWLEGALRRRPADVEAWAWRAWLAVAAQDLAEVRQIFREARDAGIPPESLQRIIQALCQEFPDICEELRSAQSP